MRIIFLFCITCIMVNAKAQTPFFYEDFSSGFNSPNGLWITNGINPWKYSFFGTSGQFSVGTPQPQFTTVANGFAIIDADSINTPNSPNYVELFGDLTSPVIDMSSYSTVFIEFESYFKTLDDSTIILSFTVDGVNYNTIGLGYMNYTIPPDSLSPNPMVVQIDITSMVAAQANAQARFSWNNMTHYFWAVDGVGFYNQAPPNPWTNVKENGEAKSDFNFYPNPASDELTIDFFNQENQEYALEITDMSGKTIIIEKGKAIGTTQKTVMDISMLSSGSYFVKYTDRNTMRFKLLQITK